MAAAPDHVTLRGAVAAADLAWPVRFTRRTGPPEAGPPVQAGATMLQVPWCGGATPPAAPRAPCLPSVYDCSYEDDKDEGEWFLYTGSGGRDLSGNKRTSKVPPPPPTVLSKSPGVRAPCMVAPQIARSWSSHALRLRDLQCCALHLGARRRCREGVAAGRVALQGLLSDFMMCRSRDVVWRGQDGCSDRGCSAFEMLWPYTIWRSSAATARKPCGCGCRCSRSTRLSTR